MTSRLLIVQPYVPAYRTELFARLRISLADQGIELSVAAGTPGVQDALREDATHEQVDFQLRQSAFRVGSRTIQYRYLADTVRQIRPDLLIAEQALKNVETLLHLFPRGHRHIPRVGLWGHGKTYGQGQPSATATWVKNKMSLRADWFFAYTQQGAQYLEVLGYPASRLTVLMNSTDTTRLRSDFKAVTDSEVLSFQQEHGLQPGKTGMFIGGVDARKGIGFLLQAAREVESRCRGFRLLIGGAGAQVDLVLEAQKQGMPVRYLARLDGKRKALALKASDVLLVPEWVGLVAADALAVGRPIVTTAHPSHCPEFEYLKHDRNAVVTRHEIIGFANTVAHLLEDVKKLQSLQAAAYLDGASLGIEAMAARFTSGILDWRDAEPRR